MPCHPPPAQHAPSPLAPRAGPPAATSPPECTTHPTGMCECKGGRAGSEGWRLQLLCRHAGRLMGTCRRPASAHIPNPAPPAPLLPPCPAVCRCSHFYLLNQSEVEAIAPGGPCRGMSPEVYGRTMQPIRGELRAGSSWSRRSAALLGRAAHRATFRCSELNRGLPSPRRPPAEACFPSGFANLNAAVPLMVRAMRAIAAGCAAVWSWPAAREVTTAGCWLPCRLPPSRLPHPPLAGQPLHQHGLS